MRTYKVVLHEVLSTTYHVEAESEEDAFDAVRCGEGIAVDKDTEPLPDEEALAAVEKVDG